MRTAFMKHLVELAAEDDRVCLVVGDLGFSVVELFAQKFPERFLNAGVAEQSMTGIAAGWSLAENKIIFTYSIANFPTMRCIEQIRNDVCAHKANVKIVSVGSGVSYGPSGYSHFAIEDLAVMGAMPHMTIFTPADPQEARHCLNLAVQTVGPAYIRLAKTGEPNLRNSFLPFGIGDFIEYRKGKDLCIVGVGSILSECLSAAAMLSSEVSVIGLPVLKPLNEKDLVDYLRNFPVLATVEEHSGRGGMAYIIAELIARYGLKVKFIKIALVEGCDIVGSQDDIRREYRLDAKGIAAQIDLAIKGF